MQVPIRLTAFCSSTGNWFTIDGTLEGRKMVWRQAQRLAFDQVEKAKSMWQGPAIGNVTIDASAFRCPYCGGANRIAEFVHCPGCDVFSCSGLDAGNRLKGPCGKCSWAREDVRQAQEFPSKAAVRM